MAMATGVSLMKSQSHSRPNSSNTSRSSHPLMSPCSENRYWRRSLLSDAAKKKNNNKSSEHNGFILLSTVLSKLTSQIDAALTLHRANKSKRSDNKEGHMIEKESKKRKIDPITLSEEEKDEEQVTKIEKLWKTKKLALSVATNAASLATEFNSIEADLRAIQERCARLEEEKRLRNEEDDMVRLQIEALLEEKSRLANDNANLTRENCCLHQLVEYHQRQTCQAEQSTCHM